MRLIPKSLFLSCLLSLFVLPFSLFANLLNAVSFPSPTFAISIYPFPTHTHQLIEINDFDRFVRLEDGSCWSVFSQRDMEVLRYWHRGNPIVITSNDHWLSFSDYRLYNKHTDTYIEADLLEFPDVFGPYSHWIVDIDYIGGHVYLENHTVWCVSSENEDVLRSWSVDDHIILGTNDSFFPYYNYILINANMDNYLKARQY